MNEKIVYWEFRGGIAASISGTASQNGTTKEVWIFKTGCRPTKHLVGLTRREKKNIAKVVPDDVKVQCESIAERVTAEYERAQKIRRRGYTRVPEGLGVVRVAPQAW
jgi:hypothetical protein